MSYILLDIGSVIDTFGNPKECDCIHKPNSVFNAINYCCNEIKRDLLQEASSGSSVEMVNHHIKIHQVGILKIINKLEDCLCQCKDLASCVEKSITPLKNNLVDFLEFLHFNFAEAFDYSLPVPQFCYNKYVLIIEDKIDKASTYSACIGDHNKILMRPFIEFINQHNAQLSFYELRYLCQTIDVFIPWFNKVIKFKTLVKLCVNYNLNSTYTFDYLTGKLKLGLATKESVSEKIIFLEYFKKKVNQSVTEISNGYIMNKKPLKQSLNTWIENEINYLINNQEDNIEKETNDSVSTPSLSQYPKIKTSLSVPQIACFIRQLIDQNIIIPSNKEATIKMFSEILASKNVDDVSSKSFRRLYFNPELRTLERTKELFLKLFKSVNI